MIDTLWIQSGYNGREAIKSLDASKRLGYSVGWGPNPDKSRCVPIGDVPYCESWLTRRPVPDFYPEFLGDWMHRGHGRIEFGATVSGGIRWFVKSAAGYKDFTAQIVEKNSPYPSIGPLVFSEVVQFVQEWRYYVADGCVLTTGCTTETTKTNRLPISISTGQKGSAVRSISGVSRQAKSLLLNANIRTLVPGTATITRPM